jgi:hypothetical protein
MLRGRVIESKRQGLALSFHHSGLCCLARFGSLQWRSVLLKPSHLVSRRAANENLLQSAASIPFVEFASFASDQSPKWPHVT